MPDFRYRQTTATLDVRGFPFKATGRQPIDLGWRAAFPDWQPADEKGDDAQMLPALRNGETAQLLHPTLEDVWVKVALNDEQSANLLIDRTAATRKPFDVKYSKVEDADWETSPLVLDPISVKEQLSIGW